MGEGAGGEREEAGGDREGAGGRAEVRLRRQGELTGRWGG